MATVYTSRTSPTTSWSGRTGVIAGNSVSPIITGYWNDLATWLETGKFHIMDNC